MYQTQMSTSCSVLVNFHKIIFYGLILTFNVVFPTTKKHIRKTSFYNLRKCLPTRLLICISPVPLKVCKDKLYKVAPAIHVIKNKSCLIINIFRKSKLLNVFANKDE